MRKSVNFKPQGEKHPNNKNNDNNNKKYVEAGDTGGAASPSQPRSPTNKVSTTNANNLSIMNNSNNNNNNNKTDRNQNKNESPQHQSDTDDELRNSSRHPSFVEVGAATATGDTNTVESNTSHHSGGGGGVVVGDDPQHGGSGTDEDDDDDDGHDGTRSSNSGSSGSSHGSKSLKSTLPCGMSISILMGLAIMVPVIFLVVYTALPLNRSREADAFLTHHRAIFEGIRNAGDINLQERLNTSLMLSVPKSSPTFRFYQAGMLNARSLFDAEVLKFTELMRSSDLDDLTLFMRDLDRIMRNVDIQREKVDAGTADSQEYRDRQIELIDQLTRLLLYFSQDSRAADNRVRILLYVLVRRTQNLFTATILNVFGVLGVPTQSQSYVESSRALRAAYDSVVSDIDYVIRSSDSAVAAEMTAIRDSPNINRWLAVCRVLLTFNQSTYGLANATNITNFFIVGYGEFDRADRRYLARIVESELLAETALDASLMMAFALVGCALALAIVIYYNNKEQKRMEGALSATSALAKAVQRFVPRNQLKTMGVRSITQVQAGMTTEVASTITFSDIREFTRLSESMSRLELFNWLQNYVSRMTKVVSEEKSYIMAFLGDGLGICSPQPTYAVNAAIKMHVAVEALNLDIVAKGGTLPIQIGVGIHHGVVVAGVFGDANRLTVSMIASEVNFASRLEALTKAFGVKILASEDVIDQISAEVFSFRNVGRVQVKGSKHAVKVYDIYQADSLKDKKFKDATKKDFESGIALIDSDPPAADKLFERIALQARMEGLHDQAAEMHSRRRRSKNNGRDKASSSVLSFEKDGELRMEEINFNNNNDNNNTDLIGTPVTQNQHPSNRANINQHGTFAFDEEKHHQNELSAASSNELDHHGASIGVFPSGVLSRSSVNNQLETSAGGERSNDVHTHNHHWSHASTEDDGSGLVPVGARSFSGSSKRNNDNGNGNGNTEYHEMRPDDIILPRSTSRNHNAPKNRDNSAMKTNGVPEVDFADHHRQNDGSPTITNNNNKKQKQEQTVLPHASE